MKNIFASMAVLTSLSQFLCLFCCVLPTATGILALISMFGFAGANSMILGDLSAMMHPHRATIMMVSISLICLSWITWYISKNKEKTSCGCHAKAKKKPIFLMIATILLVVNISAMPFLH